MRNLRLSEICNRITDGSHNPPKGVNNSDFLMIRKILASRHTLGLSDREVKKGYKYYEALQKKILSAFDLRRLLPCRQWITIDKTVNSWYSESARF